MQVNNVVCRCEKVQLSGKSKDILDYRGNRTQIGTSTVTIWVGRKHIKEIFFDINFAEDLSLALSEYLGTEIKVCPRISNVHGSKTFNFQRTGKQLKEFVSQVNKISQIEEIRMSQEQNVFSPIPLESIWADETWEANFIGVSLKANGGKLTCKIQIGKDKTKYLGTFIVSEFGLVAQRFNQLLERY